MILGYRAEYLARAGGPGSKPILILCFNEPLAAQLSGRGVDTQYAVAAGYAAMMQEPRQTLMDGQSLALLAGWLGGRWAQSGRHAADGIDEFELAFATASQAVADHGAAAEPERPGALAASELIEGLRRRLALGPRTT